MKIAVALLCFALPGGVGAQNVASRSLDSLGDAAANAVARYADRRAAAADGYHRIGPDFPGMGEHWLHPATLLSGQVSAEQPTILIYATVAGAPALLGLGFVATTDAAHPTPDLPGWPNAWHEHSGLLSDESGVAPGNSTVGDTHVWVLHVWTTLPNADGRFAPDNWALPFVRAGLAAPARVNADAARAVSLVSGGDRYIRDVLTDAVVRTTANAVPVDSVIVYATERIARVVRDMRAMHETDGPALTSLATQWRALLRGLSIVTGGDVEKYLAPAHAQPALHSHTGQR